MKRAIFGGTITIAVLALVFTISASHANAYVGSGCPTYQTYYANGYSNNFCVPSNYQTPVIQAPVYTQPAYNYYPTNYGSYGYGHSYHY